MMKLSNKIQNSSYNLKTNKNKRDSIQESYDVFGKELRSLVEVRQLPELICMLGYMIKNYGVLSQGLFRISGNKTRMDELRTIYSQSKRLEVGIDDIHNVTGLFKSFLREVPGGVIPCPQSLDLIKAARLYKRNENLDLLTNELLKLPVPHYNLLKFSCSLLYQVSRYSASNLMTPENLGTVFGPTFFASVEDMSLLPVANSASTILIQNYNSLFKVSAPVHTNLNQSTENNQRFDDCNADCTNGYVTKSCADHTTTIRFGDSCLLFSSNGETDNSLFSYSIQDEEPTPFPEFPDSFNLNNSYPNNSQFSNNLDMALRMCLTNHLFNQFQENDLVDMTPICAPRLISDMMLNPQIVQVPESYNSMKQFPSNMKNVGKKKSVDESATLSLPRREIASNILHNYLANHNTDQKGPDMAIKSDSSPPTSDIVLNNESNYEKQSHPVPQLDLSILYDTPGPEKSRPVTETKNSEVNKNKYKPSFDNSRDLNSESKIHNYEVPLDQIKKSIINLKRQLRQFEDEYYSTNGVRPDKSVRANNEWYSRSIAELKLLRQEKEQLMNGNDRTDDYESAESGRNVKKKSIGASGDVTDHRTSYGVSSDARSVLSRPVSALSEIATRMTPSNESARSNTLNSMTTATNQAPDLSQSELDSLKIALEKISNHLTAERIRDNRPNDLDLMSQQQIETEKVSMQKALLNFESTYGRKKTPNAVSLMRPLYDRYRQVKKRLSSMNETQGLEWKIAHRTQNTQSKQDVCQSAWTSDRPLSSAMQSLTRNNVPQANNRTIYIPTTSQFDIGEEFNSPGQRRSDPSNESAQTVNASSQRRNVRTIQYRRSSAQTTSDSNNNKRFVPTIDKIEHVCISNTRVSSQKDERRTELQQLHSEKKDLQRILKDFENTFERDTKRKVEKMDRLPMEREYSRYKFIKNRIKELEDSLEISLS